MVQAKSLSYRSTISTSERQPVRPIDKACDMPRTDRSVSSSHFTPEHQAVYTSTDSSVIAPPMRHTPVEAMPDHREIHNPSTPYQPTTNNSSRPPSTGLTGRPYPYASKYLFDDGGQPPSISFSCV